MRKTLLFAALFALGAGPALAQDVAGAAGNEIGKAANQAAREAADHAATSAGMKTKNADKKSSKSESGKSMQAAQNSGAKPTYSAPENKPATEDAAAPGDAQQSPAPPPDARE